MPDNSSTTTLTPKDVFDGIPAFMFIAAITIIIAIKIVILAQTKDGLNFAERISNMASVTRNLYTSSLKILTRPPTSYNEGPEVVSANAKAIIFNTGWAKNFYSDPNQLQKAREDIISESVIIDETTKKTLNTGLVYLPGGGDVYMGAIFRYTSFGICVITLVLLCKFVYEAWIKKHIVGRSETTLGAKNPVGDLIKNNGQSKTST